MNRLYDARVIVDVALELWRNSDTEQPGQDPIRPAAFVQEAFALLEAADKLLPPAPELPSILGGGTPMTEDQIVAQIKKLAQAFREGYDGEDWQKGEG